MTRAILASGLAFLLTFAVVAPSTVVGQGADAGVTNVAPTLDSIVVNNGATITPTQATNITVEIDITASDANGFGDIGSIAWTVTNPDAATFASGTVTDFTGCGPSGTTVVCTVTFTVGYYHKPGTYTFDATVTDASAATGSASVTKAVASIMALGLDVSAVSFGNLAPGEASVTPQRVQVLNRGNTNIDIEVSGTDLTHATLAASIPVGSLTRSLASDMTGAAALTGTPTAITTFSLAYGMGVKKATYWKLTMPTGADQFIPPGDYTGEITISAITDA